MSISQLLLIGLIIGLGLGIFVVRYFDHPIRNFIAKLTPPKIRFSEDSFNVQTKRRYYLVLVLVIIISTSVAWGIFNVFYPFIITEETKVKQQVKTDAYYILIKKYHSLEQAQQHQKNLQIRWSSAVFIASKEQSDDLFELIIGPFETKKNAIAFIKKHQLKGTIKRYNTSLWLE